jgi:hypothetical protein
MRIRAFVLAALVALAVPSIAVGHTAKQHSRGHHQKAAIVGTWDVKVTIAGQPTFPALLVFTKGGSVIETESDMPGTTGLGSWKQIAPDRFAVAFRVFFFDEKGAPAGSVTTRSVATLSNDTLSAPFKSDVSDPTGKVMQSTSGTATATRFVIPAF